jgi:hypothetical protein
MTTRCYFDNQTGISFKLTDEHGDKYQSVKHNTYTTIELPYYGGVSKTRTFKLTPKGLSFDPVTDYINFTLDSRGTFISYKINGNVQDAVPVVTTTSTTATVSTVTAGTIVSESTTTLASTTINTAVDVRAAITTKKQVTIPLYQHRGENTTVVGGPFTTEIISKQDDTLVIFPGYKYDHRYSQ